MKLSPHYSLVVWAPTTNHGRAPHIHYLTHSPSQKENRMEDKSHEIGCLRQLVVGLLASIT